MDAIEVILYLFDAMMKDENKGTECEGWTKWMMAAFLPCKMDQNSLQGMFLNSR
jgi:hypothetical protein